MFPALKIAADMKQEALAVLDRSRNCGRVTVNANQLVDLCIAFECAAKGDVSNLEYIIERLGEDLAKAERKLSAIVGISEIDSEIYNIAIGAAEQEQSK